MNIHINIIYTVEFKVNKHFWITNFEGVGEKRCQSFQGQNLRCLRAPDTGFIIIN